MISLRKILFPFLIITIIVNISCSASESGQVVISKPDENTHTYEANEKTVLNAVARVFKNKSMGTNIRIDREMKQVETDYFIRDDWRTKSLAKIKKLNWKETEVVIAVTTEKKTEKGWEMRRLLDVEQYEKLFDTIDTAIYEEMSKIE